MKKVLLYAYLNNNLGDDLFIDILCKRYPYVQFIAVKEKNFKEMKTKFPLNFKILYRNRFINLINKISWKLWKKNAFEYIVGKMCDAIVYIGGSIFAEPQERKEALMDYRKSFFVRQIPFLVIGANFGPYYTPDYLKEMKSYFEKCKDVCFRDCYSRNLFKEMHNIRYAPDIVHTICFDENREKTKTIGISLIAIETIDGLCDYANDYYNLIKSVIDRIVIGGYRVALLSFCDASGDKNACQKVYNMLGSNIKSCVEISSYEGNCFDYLEKLKKLQAMIATRFHSMILGLRLKIPTVVLSYDCKINQVIDDLQYKVPVVNVDQIAEIDADTILKLLLKDTIDSESLAELARLAEKQFEGLDRQLL